jgi:hypothetical protein
MSSVRWLVCLDLQQAWITRHADEPDEAFRDRLAGARLALRRARETGWRVVHVHRRDSADEDVISIGRSPPAEGLRPLPREALFHREQLCAFSSRAFTDALRHTPRASLAILVFDLPRAGLITAMRAVELGHRVTLLQDATAGTDALRATHDLVATLENSRLTVGPFEALWPGEAERPFLMAANQP